MSPKKHKPPKIAEWILNRIATCEDYYSIAGDFEEEYRERVLNSGPLKARMWYWRQGRSLDTTILEQLCLQECCHVKKLCSDSFEKSQKAQRVFVYQHFGTGYRYGSLYDNLRQCQV